jgi:hypothetical protein
MPFTLKKIGWLFLIIFMVYLFDNQAIAQLRPKKGRNLRITNYKGNIKSFSNKRYLALGMSLNSMNYFGDLAPKSGWASTDISFTKPGIGFVADYKYAPRITFFANLTYGALRGDDFESADPEDPDAKFRYIRNLQFRNRIIELSAGGKIDLFTNRGTYLSRPIINPYIFGGVAVFHHNPQAIAPSTDQLGEPIAEAGKWVDLEPLGTEGQYSSEYNVKPYKRFQISLPVGIGAKYTLNNILDISLEVGYRILFFDYIDDVSSNYVDLGALGSPLAKALSDRSQEPKAAVSGQSRDFEGTVLPNSSYYTYVSKYDGKSYTVLAGYGSEYPTNNRGGISDNDIYIVTSVRVTYIIGGTFRNAKFR